MNRFLLGCLLLVFPIAILRTQTSLNPGDLAIIGINTDDPDDFAFVLLKDIETGTEIRFTDSGWYEDSVTFRGNEGCVKYTAPGDIISGTVITFFGNSDDFVSDNDSVVGTYGFNLASAGDQILVFQGLSASPSFIFAIQTNSTLWQTGDPDDPNQSALPAGLTDGTYAVAVGSGSGAEDEYDNVLYTGTTSFSSPAEALASICDADNWSGDDTNRYQFTTEDFTLPITLSSFTAILVQNEFVSIMWTTESESNMSYYNLYRDDFLVFTIEAENSTQTTVYSYLDNEVEDNYTYSYLLEAVQNDQTTYHYGPIIITVDLEEQWEDPPVPEYFRAIENYPNPFNPETTISFTIPESEQGILTVFNIKGEKLVEAEFEPGEHNYLWDASSYGSGFYLCRIRTDSYTQTRKMMMTK